MPAFVTLDSVSVRLPDGRSLFDTLTLALGPERTGLVGRNGTGKSTLLKLISGEVAPSAGAVSVSCRLGVLRQAYGAQETVADLCGCSDDLARLARIEAGEGSEDDFALADWELEARLASALADVGLPGLDLQRPAASLSG
ncbi:MAG TPA: ATP-binding cassette domain-containing protein, partial [Phenylobacterium sp.]|nr:ATP-binding cassette domain-containing protein [Phenylobacterium sp.]